MSGTSAAEVGAQLRSARIAAGLSQQDLADRSGVSRLTIGLIERGHPAGELGKVLSVAAALGLQLSFVPAGAASFSLDVIDDDSEPL